MSPKLRRCTLTFLNTSNLWYGLPSRTLFQEDLHGAVSSIFILYLPCSRNETDMFMFCSVDQFCPLRNVFFNPRVIILPAGTEDHFLIQYIRTRYTITIKVPYQFFGRLFFKGKLKIRK